MKLKELLQEVNRIMKPHVVYAVGGCVRDFILGIEPKDYDFCTSATPDEIEVHIKASGKRAYLVGKKYGTIGCKIKVGDESHMVEITTFRIEKYESGSRKPEVEFVKSITEDLSRRDFSINSIAARLGKDGRFKIIDPFGGRDDLLKHKIIKCVGNPKTRFKEDPLRMLRAIRFSCRFDFKIEQKTMEKMKKEAIKILNISKERWVMEIDKILQSDNPGRGLDLLWKSGLFKYMIPELDLMYGYDQNSQYHPWTLDVHTVYVVQAIRSETDDLNMLWAGLLHDSCKIFVKTENKKGYSNYIGHEILGAELVDKYARYLKWSNDRHKKVRELVLHHLEDDCELRKYDNMGKS